MRQMLEYLDRVLEWISQWGEWPYIIACLLIGGLGGWFLTWKFYKKTSKTQKEELETELRKRARAEEICKQYQEKCAEYEKTINEMQQYCGELYIREALTPDSPDKAVTAILNGDVS